MKFKVGDRVKITDYFPFDDVRGKLAVVVCLSDERKEFPYRVNIADEDNGEDWPVTEEELETIPEIN